MTTCTGSRALRPFPPIPRCGRGASTVVSACIGVALLCFATDSLAAQAPPQRQWLGEDGTPLPFTSDAEVTEFLRTADVVSRRELDIGTTRPDLLILERGSVRARAVFRDVDKHRERTKLPDGGDYAMFYDRAIHEVAAYELGLLLGLDLIPPTVERYMGGQRGTVQLWIEGAMTEGQRKERGLQPPVLRRWRYQQQIMRVFDALVHNSDRNSGNSLVDGQWNLWMIDHTRAFQRPRGAIEFPTINQLPATLWDAMQRLDRDLTRERLSRYLEPLQIASMFRRHARLIEHVRRLIAERGEEAVLLAQRPAASASRRMP